MRRNKGQITIFLILGFVMATAFGFIYYLNIPKEPSTEIEKSTNIVFSAEGLENFLNLCLYDIANDGVIFISQRGGYINLPHYSYNNSFIKTAYYFYEDRSLLPTIDVLENSISNYTKLEAHSCFDKLNNSKEITSFDYRIESITTKIIKGSILVDIKMPVNIKVGDVGYNIEKFGVRLDGDRLYDVYNFSEFVIEKQLEDRYSLCLSCIINKAVNDDLYVDIENIGNNNFIFKVMYNNTKLNYFYKFIFANKYKEISCGNIPLDTDEVFLERFIESCTLQEIEKYNYSFKVDGVKDVLNAYVGIPFTIKINATGFNLNFFDYTDLFNIEQKTGIINFTPTKEQLGEHIVLISIIDGFGNEEIKEIYIDVLEA